MYNDNDRRFNLQDPDGSLMKSMGQNSKLLSDIDIVKINSVYGNKCLRRERTKDKESEAIIPKKQKREHSGKNTKATVA